MNQRGTIRPPATEGAARRAAAPTPAERQFALRITVNQSFYAKLMRAHESVRHEDGSRAELRELLELAIDHLLANRSVHPSVAPPAGGRAAADADEEPLTVRAPSTMRWHPSCSGP
ncbi:MAG: hypothetical protein JW751_24680 [Polyangiaceae bacterium]|nr:hypothetical protein [Polyangiaceae bacterium]